MSTLSILTGWNAAADPFVEPEALFNVWKTTEVADTHFSEHQIFRQWFPDESVQEEIRRIPSVTMQMLPSCRTLWQIIHTMNC